MKRINKQAIYQTVSTYYRKRKLTKEEFTDRLKVIHSLVGQAHSLRGSLDYLDMKEGWHKLEGKERTAKRQTEKEDLKVILNLLGYEWTMKGLVANLSWKEN